MQKRILIMSMTLIITTIILLILGYINLLQTKNNDNNFILNDPIIESQPEFNITYDEYQIYQDVDRYNRIINLYKKVEKEAEIIPIKTDIKVDIWQENKKNNLNRIPVYAINYKSQYLINPEQQNIKKIRLTYRLPSKKTVFDNFKIIVNNNELKNFNLNDKTGEIISDIQFDEGDFNKIQISYTARGSEYWKYNFGENIKKIIDFNLDITTNFKKIVFPGDCLPAIQKTGSKNSTNLRWNYKNLLIGNKLGITIPQKYNPYKLAALLSFSGPIGLLFFLLLLYFILNYDNKEFITTDYFFISLSFISFYIIFSFTIKYLDIYTSLITSLIISLIISGIYMYFINGIKFTILNILIPQFFCLITLFFSFIFKEFTGLIISISFIITIFISMIINIKSTKTQYYKTSRGL